MPEERDQALHSGRGGDNMAIYSRKKLSLFSSKASGEEGAGFGWEPPRGIPYRPLRGEEAIAVRVGGGGEQGQGFPTHLPPEAGLGVQNRDSLALVSDPDTLGVGVEKIPNLALGAYGRQPDPGSE